MTSKDSFWVDFSGDLAIRNLADVSSWLGGLRTLVRQSGVDYAVSHFYAGVKLASKMVEDEIEIRTPKYDLVKSTSSYTIFKVHNFAGAKKLRDQVKADWCIGASDLHFKQYGKKSGNDTYIVFLLKSKTGMVCHSGQRPLITNHGNNKDWIVRNGDIISSRGGNSVQDEFSELTTKELYDVLTTCKINVDISSL